MDKKVICFSLWGNDLKYTYGAIRNAEIAKTVYPDWICRYYIGKSTDQSVIEELNLLDNTEIILMDEDGDWTGMFWRFHAASDPTVSVMLSRDSDSRVCYREKFAVEEWLNSDKSFHIMRDHPCHQTQILGGMWGVKNPKLSNIKTLIDNYTKGNFWQVDQNFLREVIYPLIVDDCFVHDQYCKYNSHSRHFPYAKVGELARLRDDGTPGYFVGKTYLYGDKGDVDGGFCWRDDE